MACSLTSARFDGCVDPADEEKEEFEEFCPIELVEGGEGAIFDIPDSGDFLGFAGDGGEGCEFFPNFTVISDTSQGVGVACDSFFGEGGEGGNDTIEVDETLVIEGCEGSFCDTLATRMTGIYISGVFGETVDGGEGGEDCTGDEGTVEVWTGVESSSLFSWSAPSTEGGEGGSACEVEGEQTIFVPFADIGDGGGGPGLLATSIEVSVDSQSDSEADSEPGVYVLGTEDCDGGELSEDGRCAVEVFPPESRFTGPGGEPEPSIEVIAAAEVVIDPVPGFPLRIQDPRPACGPAGVDGTIANTALPIDTVTVFSPAGLTSPGLPLYVDPATPGAIFTISAKACGVPRANDGGSPDAEGATVDRDSGDTDWTPFIDVIAIEAGFDPVADTTEFRSSDLDFEFSGTDFYECNVAAVELGTADRNQPFLEINARPDEIKYVSGVSTPVIDPVGRDIMVGCGGSKRGISRRWSYLAYNVIHAPGVDFVSETAEEISTLSQSTARLRSCIDPGFYARDLQPRVARISRNYDIFARYVTRSTRIAERYLSRAEDGISDLIGDLSSRRDGVRCMLEHI